MSLKFPKATVHIMNKVSDDERQDIQEAALAGQSPTVEGLRIEASTGESPSGLEVRGTITSSTGKEGGASTLKLEVFNLDDELAQGTQIEGFVKVEAGYARGDFGSFDIAPTADTPLFFGMLVDRFPIRNDDSDSWRFVANTVPSLLQASTVVDIGPIPEGERGPTIGQVIKEVLGRAGATLLPSAASIGINGNIPNNRKVVEIKELRAEGPIMAIAEELTKDIGDQISRALGKQNVHTHTLSPVQNSPMSFRLTDAGDPARAVQSANQAAGRPVADVRLDQMTVHRAAPSLKQGEFDVSYPPSLIPGKAAPAAKETAEAQQKAVQDRSQTYNFSGALDPRMSVGTPARIIDPRLDSGNGFCVLTEVKHRFGREWRTDWSGPFGILPEDAA